MKRAGGAPRALRQPRRTCLGCGAPADKSELLRLRADGRGELLVDDGGSGRGGYLHRAQVCWEKFMRRRSVYRAFHVEIGKNAKQTLVEVLKERHGE